MRTDPQHYAVLKRVLEHAEDFLFRINDRSVATTTTPEELRARFFVELKDEGVDPVTIIDELVKAAEGGLLGTPCSRFFAWVIGGTLPAAMAADWLTSLWDQNAGMYAVAPAAAVTEEVAGDWLKQLFELPREASFAFTTGCQMAHFTALAAARQALLQARGWDVNDRGLFAAPPFKVLASAERHKTVDRAINFLGIGAQQLLPVATDNDGRIRHDALREELARCDGPMVVVLNAADLNIGAFDDFKTVIPIAKEAGAWVHVDGAFGLFARLSRSKRHLLEGVELADSWVTNGHKLLNVPFDCGMAFIRDAAAHRASMTASASYIADRGLARDQVDWNPDFSRRARGFTVYAALRELGRSGLEQMVDRCCDSARAIVDGIGKLPNAQVLWRPHFNQGLVRFLDPAPTATDADHDNRTDAMIRRINATGEAFFSGTTWRGKKAMRVSVVNWRTDETDVARTLQAIATVTSQDPTTN